MQDMEATGTESHGREERFSQTSALREVPRSPLFPHAPSSAPAQARCPGCPLAE